MKLLVLLALDLLKTRTEDEVLAIFEEALVTELAFIEMPVLKAATAKYSTVQLLRLHHALSDYRIAVVLAVDYIASENWGDDHE